MKEESDHFETFTVLVDEKLLHSKISVDAVIALVHTYLYLILV